MKSLRIKQTPDGVRLIDFNPIAAIAAAAMWCMFFYFVLNLDDQGLLPPEITDEVNSPFDSSPRVATWFLLGVFGFMGLIMSLVSNFTRAQFNLSEGRVYWKRISLFGLSWRTLSTERITDLRLDVGHRFVAGNLKDDYRMRVILEVDGKPWPLSNSPHVMGQQELDEYRDQIDDLRGQLGFKVDSEESKKQFLK
ncbi:hypothetical protein Pla110_05020 [Polystyrenella longa]|uniref:DUF304 domain-containing protein n=1 Tax=Polystyrenella longa TaxID=2528007 RepID=A0A518CHT8_9PLAN|nr:hypothetical protein [Polystyrenella longa]QDU78798.1 hypothetical protein Pla110_05020 [Polystyrenella longa]